MNQIEIEANKNLISFNQIKVVGLRLIVGFVLFSWIMTFPAYLLVIYMLVNKFFSYDILIDGLYANGIFIIAATIFLISVYLFLYGFIFFLANGFKERKLTKITHSTRIYFWISFLFSTFLHFVIVLYLFEKSISVLTLIPFVILGVFSVIFITSYTHSDFKYGILDWKKPFVFLVLSIFLPLSQPKLTADFVSIGLKTFRVGGGIHSSIYEKNPEARQISSGKLLLLGPNVAYLRDSEGKLNVIPLSDQTWVKIW